MQIVQVTIDNCVAMQALIFHNFEICSPNYDVKITSKVTKAFPCRIFKNSTHMRDQNLLALNHRKIPKFDDLVPGRGKFLL